MRRREGNTRICARPGLPPPVKRFLPLEDRRCVIKEWAQLLAWRTGWHGLAAASGRRMFYMLRHVNSTYVIDLESQRVDGRHPYHLKEDFVLSDHIIPLTAFELKFNSDDVHTVFHFHVEATPCDAGGINLRPVRAVVITDPLPYRKIAAKAKGEDDADDEVDADEVAEDSCEDLCDEHPASDLDEDELVADTDGPSVDESCNSVTSSDSSGLEEADVPADDAAKGERSATGGRRPATGGPHLYDNGYFYIKGNALDVKILIHNIWVHDPPGGLGRVPAMSKTITPSRMGESREEAMRSMLLLRAWMLWRAKGVAGWIEKDCSRQRLFAEEEEKLYTDIQRMQPQADGLLGNALASATLRDWVPDLVARM